MRVLIFILFSLLGREVSAQHVSDYHTFFGKSGEPLYIHEGNTLHWFLAQFDSTIIDNKVIAYKRPSVNRYNAFFIILDANLEVVSTNEFHTQDTTLSTFNSNIFIQKGILIGESGYFVSFHFTGHNLLLNEDTLINDPESGTNFCIARFSTSGKLLSFWRFPVAISIQTASLGVLPNNKTLIAGTLSWKNIQLGPYYLPCTGCLIHDTDILVAVLDSTGAVLNAKRFGSFDADYCYDIQTTANGDIYLTGCFYGSPFQVDGFSATNTGFTQITSDIFLVKLNADLEAQWLKTAGGNGSETGRTLALGQPETLYWAGNYGSAGFILDDFTLSGKKTNSFVARVAPSGAVEWVKNTGSDDFCSISGFDADEHGNAWASFNFGSMADIDGQQLTGQGGREGALAQFAPDGGLLQIYHLSGPDNESIYQIQVLPGDQLLFSGSFEGDTLSFLNMRLPASPYGYNSTSYYATLQLPTVGTNEAKPDPENALMRIWPNPAPAQSPINITFSTGPAQFCLYDCLGRPVWRQAEAATAGEWQLPAWVARPGVYVLEGRFPGGSVSGMLIINE